MKKYKLTPVGLEPVRKPRIFPATKRQELTDRIQMLEDSLHRVFANPQMSSREKLLRQGEIVQAYREAYAELNKPVFAPPFSSEYLGPLPREGKRDEKQEEINQFLSGLITKAEEEEEEEEEEKTANASRIMSMFSPRQSIGSSRYDSPTGPFVTPPPPFNVSRELTPKAKPRYAQPTLASLRSPRVTKKPSRFGFGKEGRVRRPRRWANKKDDSH